MTKKLKIGIVVDQLLAGGVQLAAIEQVKELRRLGHQAKLLILMRKKYTTDFSYLVKNVSHQYLSDSYPLFLQKTVKFPIFSFLSTLHLMSPLLAPNVVKKKDYDILVSFGSTTCLTTQAIYKKNAIPYLALIHDPIEYILEKAYSKTSLHYFFSILKPMARYFERSFVKDALQTLIISKVHKNYIQKNYNIDAQIVTFGTKTLQKLPPKRGVMLLSFGRWQKEKNPEFLIKLMKSLPKKKLTIAGNWINKEELKKFQEKIVKEHMSKQITVVPYYDEKRLTELCEQARLWVYPHFEAFGLAALEAAAHGLPIIMPEKSGVTEMFTHTVDGFFPKKVDVKEYKKYITLLLADEPLANTIGRNAWKLVRKNFSWKLNVQNLLDIINSALNPPTASNIFVLEVSHALGAPLAGGDKLMEPMAVRLANKYLFSIIVSSVGAKHWQDAPLEKKMVILPRNRFDASGKALHVFLAYCIRMWQTYKTLLASNRIKKHTQHLKSQTILYSSTNILPDILPAYFIKKRHPNLLWIARVHHLIPPPHKREGRFFVNIVSYLMQQLALFMMKSQADMTIVLNTQIEKDLQKKGFNKKTLQVLGGGIEFEKIRSIKPKNFTKYQGVFLGRLHIAKGIYDTIPIWQEITKTHPGAKLAIIGDGPLEIKQKLESHIVEAKLSKNIKIFGFLSYPEVYSILKQADVFLFLDHEAGWGLAVAEAMAAGLPVVGYDTGVLDSVYKKGYRKVKLADHKKFANEVLHLLENNTIRKKLSSEAVQEAMKYDWKITSNKFSHLLEKELLQS